MMEGKSSMMSRTKRGHADDGRAIQIQAGARCATLAHERGCSSACSSALRRKHLLCLRLEGAEALVRAERTSTRCEIDGAREYRPAHYERGGVAMQMRRLLLLGSVIGLLASAP